MWHNLSSVLYNNWTGHSNGTTDEKDPAEEAEEEKDHHHLILASLLFSFCLATVLGNLLVVAAVARERYLHTVTNYFITSLAVADCLVGSIVMPFSAAVEMRSDRRWIFGPDLCDVWHSFDVLASTASILNLCVISMDRYWAITDPFTYPGRMTPKRAACFIALVWVCSSLISFPAIAWWRAVANETASSQLPFQQCVFTDDVGYLVFSSTVSFYGPLSVMVFTYYRIYRAAVAQTRSLALGVKQVVASSSQMGETVELTLRIHRGGRAASDSRRCAAAAALLSSGSPSMRTTTTTNPSDGHHHPPMEVLSTLAESIEEADQQPGMSGGRVPLSKTNFSLSRKLAKIAKERKAAKTLGIVMGVFIACWLPFFVTNLLSAFCPPCIRNPELVMTVVTWLGWLNSGMNPVIYACWSRDFRRAFARILCGCCPGLFHRWKRHSAKGTSNSNASQSSNAPVPSSSSVAVARTPSSTLQSPMTASLSFSSLSCHHSSSSNYRI